MYWATLNWFWNSITKWVRKFPKSSANLGGDPQTAHFHSNIVLPFLLSFPFRESLMSSSSTNLTHSDNKGHMPKSISHSLAQELPQHLRSIPLKCHIPYQIAGPLISTLQPVPQLMYLEFTQQCPLCLIRDEFLQALQVLYCFWFGQ